MIYEICHHMYYEIPGSLFERLSYTIICALMILLGKYIVSQNLNLIPYVNLLISLSLIHYSTERIHFIHPKNFTVNPW